MRDPARWAGSCYRCCPPALPRDGSARLVLRRGARLGRGLVAVAGVVAAGPGAVAAVAEAAPAAGVAAGAVEEEPAGPVASAEQGQVRGTAAGPAPGTRAAVGCRAG
jgi:hypothetical protein